MHVIFKVVAVIFALFLVLFVAVIVEESFFGGRRRRRLDSEMRKKLDGEGAKP